MCGDRIEVELRREPPSKFTWWWHQKSRNGEIVCSSETFDNVSNARRAAKAQAKKLGGVKVIDFTKGKP